MGLLNSTQFIKTSIKDVSLIDSDFRNHFENKGFTVSIESNPMQAHYSISKGGYLKQTLGLKAGLNIEIIKETGGIKVSMKVGLFSKYAAATTIAALSFPIVLLPELIGVIEQSKLDKEAYSVIAEAAVKCEMEEVDNNQGCCPVCGAKIPNSSKFCLECGAKIEEKEVCATCGAELFPNADFCIKCGTRIER